MCSSFNLVEDDANVNDVLLSIDEFLTEECATMSLIPIFDLCVNG